MSLICEMEYRLGQRTETLML